MVPQTSPGFHFGQDMLNGNGLAIAPPVLRETMGVTPLSLKWLGNAMLPP
ncbi:hypothetical protein AtDm6_1674 [Acetobacter tropicalis]|uniref:Uncharacterized protein n=1 Tax=Acetobacter tropicalis TaxID=104102 RepID=A0A094YRM7_9PROT|nr:hypothetical protein [Acetobacter tropicalis]KGB23239.1 hypothetical protein AtDm6_1674 [Acetobacter tropicalis]MDO8171058.1 hypothetical protein [Acetobacter tropicalis]